MVDQTQTPDAAFEAMRAQIMTEYESAAAPTVLFPADLWRRATDEEAEAIDGAMNEQPLRIRRLFLTAQTFQSDDPLWPLLSGAATALFGEDRAAELLAPSA